jgi:2-polyprenyl-3-methyl-5-hydroxy-6-metoxy-1,4-benzoquinol methylase
MGSPAHLVPWLSRAKAAAPPARARFGRFVARSRAKLLEAGGTVGLEFFARYARELSRRPGWFMMHPELKYETLERIDVSRPVDRLAYIVGLCRGKRVLDIGCLDETALIKRDTEHWLHGRIAEVAASVVGIDASAQIPNDGITTGPASVIYRGDGTNPSPVYVRYSDIDIIVAGEFIEHIERPIEFVRTMQQRFPGRELIISTPNGCSLANGLLGTIAREAQHHDHVHIFTYKILNTLCLRAGVPDWEIVPYRFYATEMLLNTRGAKRSVVRAVQSAIRLSEYLFPLLSFGYVVRVRL